MNNQEDIDGLLSKFFSGNASPEEAIRLEDWKNENKDHLAYYLSSAKIYQAINNAPISEEVNSDLAWRKINNQISPEAVIVPINNKRNLYIQIAASITFISILGVLLSYYINLKQSPAFFYTSKNKPIDLQLTDGSAVVLSGNSQLALDKLFGTNNRILHLKGEAKFNVVHQEEMPFIVQAGDLSIKDVGTIFSVSNTGGDSIAVKVEEGVVLAFNNFGSELELKAGEEAVYLRSEKQFLKQKPESTGGSYLYFNGEKLAEVVAQLNEIYETKIVLENAELGDCSITTEFKDENLDTILSIITETLGLSFEKTQNGYLIKGKKCQS